MKGFILYGKEACQIILSVYCKDTEQGSQITSIRITDEALSLIIAKHISIKQVAMQEAVIISYHGGPSSLPIKAPSVRAPAVRPF